jgi:hypothetical protein
MKLPFRWGASWAALVGIPPVAVVVIILTSHSDRLYRINASAWTFAFLPALFGLCALSMIGVRRRTELLRKLNPDALVWIAMRGSRTPKDFETFAAAGGQAPDLSYFYSVLMDPRGIELWSAKDATGPSWRAAWSAIGSLDREMVSGTWWDNSSFRGIGAPFHIEGQTVLVRFVLLGGGAGGIFALPADALDETVRRCEAWRTAAAPTPNRAVAP